MTDQPQENVQNIPMAQPIFAPPPPMAMPAQKLGDNAGVRMLLPVGRSGWAIAAGYAGLLSFVMFPGPIALILSLIALSDLRKHPEKRGRGRAVFGLVMGVISTLALVVFAIGRFAGAFD